MKRADEYDNFHRTMRELMSVPHDEIMGLAGRGKDGEKEEAEDFGYGLPPLGPCLPTVPPDAFLRQDRMKEKPCLYRRSSSAMVATDSSAP
jgi:hypothetical protein